MVPTKAHGKRIRDDKAHLKSRLSDAAFNPTRYPDPLEARPSPDPKSKVPEGVTAEMTQSWLDAIRKAKAQRASS